MTTFRHCKADWRHLPHRWGVAAWCRGRLLDPSRRVAVDRWYRSRGLRSGYSAPMTSSPDRAGYTVGLTVLLISAAVMFVGLRADAHAAAAAGGILGCFGIAVLGFTWAGRKP